MFCLFPSAGSRSEFERSMFSAQSARPMSGSGRLSTCLFEVVGTAEANNGKRNAADGGNRSKDLHRIWGDDEMTDGAYWDSVLAEIGNNAPSWFQRYPARSLEMIKARGADPETAIIDVGAGTSTLTAELLRLGYSELWALDISSAALLAARRNLGASADRVHWMEADVTTARLPPGHFDIWHVRAVFHFLTKPADRRAYVANGLRAIKPGGLLIIAIFAEDGPTRCSGLPVVRYDAESLAAQFGNACEVLQTEKEVHQTPSGKTQSFRYTLMRRRFAR